MTDTAVNATETTVNATQTAGKGPKPIKRRTAFDLKMIAVITMLIDHISAVILEKQFMRLVPEGYLDNVEALTPWLMEHRSVAILYLVSVVMRIIGRMAFPIYAFLLTEGLKHTRDVRKYALNLGVFALISEIPFDLANGEALINPGYQSVFFTLLIGLGCIYLLSKIEQMATMWKPVLVVVTILGFAVVAEFLRTDYGAMGVIAIAAMYMLRSKRIFAFLLGCMALVIASPVEIFALFMLIPIAKYNGEKGREVNKYLFYGFYPAHLLILYLIGLAIGTLSFSVMAKEPEIAADQSTETSASYAEPVKEATTVEQILNSHSFTSIPTAIRKIGDLWFIDDCYNDQIIYNENLTDPLTSWKVLADAASCGLHQSHTLDGDGKGTILADDTENNRVLVFNDKGGGYELSGVFENIGNRPHFTMYHEATDTFYVLSSCSGELFMFKKDKEGRVYKAGSHVFSEIAHVYVRSFTIDEESIIFVSGLAADEYNTQSPAILVYDFDNFEKTAEYPVPEEIAGMVEIAHIGNYYYATVSTDLYGSQEKATILKAKELAGFQYGTYEDIYARFFVKGGTPYFMGQSDGTWYMTEHRSDRNKIWRLDVDQNGNITGAEVIY